MSADDPDADDRSVGGGDPGHGPAEQDQSDSTLTGPDPTDELATTKKSHRSLIIGLVGAVIAVGIVIAGLIVWSEASTVISDGSGTAAISWMSPTGGYGSQGNPPLSFSGTINGHSLNGIATNPLTSNGTNPFLAAGGTGKAVKVFRYKGTFAGKQFDLGVFINATHTSLGPYVPFMIRGTYDGQAVTADVTAPINSIGTPPPFHFNGTIGKWKVTGTIRSVPGTSRKQMATATATFTVSH